MEQNRTPYQDMQKILTKIQSDNLHISRIPKDTKDKFIKLANDQFCGDYGFCLKFMIEGLIDVDTQTMYQKIDELEQRISYLEPLVQKARESDEESEDEIKFASGKSLNRKK